MPEYISSFDSDIKLVKALEQYSKHLNVLLVEDNPAIRSIYEMWLRKFFASYEIAEDGQQAMQILDRESFDIVITDIEMPVMNGIELIKNRQALDKDQLFVVLSSHCTSDTLLNLIDLGVDHFICKENEVYFFLFTLHKVCRDIYLEQKLKKLQKSVLQLENEKLATLDMLSSYDIVSEAHKEMLKVPCKKQEAQSYVSELGSDAIVQLEHLEDLEENANIIIERFVSQPEEYREAFKTLFEEYAQAISRLHEFENLAYATASIYRSLENVENWQDNKGQVKDMLFAVLSNLMRWRDELLVKKSLEDIHFYDISLISDCVQMEIFFGNKAVEEDVEFFQ